MGSNEISGTTPLVPLDQNNNANKKNGKKIGKNYEKYSLRPRSIEKRIETEKRAKEPKKVPKPKLKAPPLSKYRRKTANARERSRMQEINYAFDILQKVVPQYPVLPVNAQGKSCEKLTKITTLRLAMNYISSLNSLLSELNSNSNGNTIISSASSTASDISMEDRFITLSPSTSSMAESSPASSTTSNLSSSFANSNGFSPPPIQHPPTPTPISITTPKTIHSNSTNSIPTPNCLQTVMRSVVLPSTRRSAVTNSKQSSTFTTTTFPTSSSSFYPNTTTCMTQTNFISQHQHHLSPQPPQPLSPASGLMMTLSTNVKLFNPTIQKYSNTTRTGSISSLTESDLSEYTSDLLSEEGSSLDDPMFDDIIGIGVDSGICGSVDDLDHLILHTDGENLRLTSPAQCQS